MSDRARKAEQAFLARGKSKVADSGGFVSSGGLRVPTPATGRTPTASAKKVAKKQQPASPHPKTPNPFKAPAWPGSARSPSCNIGKTSPREGQLLSSPTPPRHAQPSSCHKTLDPVEDVDIRLDHPVEDADVGLDCEQHAHESAILEKVEVSQHEEPADVIQTPHRSMALDTSVPMMNLQEAAQQVQLNDLISFRTQLDGVVDSGGQSILRMPPPHVQAAAVAVLCSTALIKGQVSECLQEELVDEPLPPEAWVEVQEILQACGCYKSSLRKSLTNCPPLVLDIVMQASSAITTLLADPDEDESCPVAYHLQQWLVAVVNDLNSHVETAVGGSPVGGDDRRRALENAAESIASESNVRAKGIASDETVEVRPVGVATFEPSASAVHESDLASLTFEESQDENLGVPLGASATLPTPAGGPQTPVQIDYSPGQSEAFQFEATVNINCLQDKLLMVGDDDSDDQLSDPAMNFESGTNDMKAADDKTSPFILCSVTRDVLSPPPLCDLPAQSNGQSASSSTSPTGQDAQCSVEPCSRDRCTPASHVHTATPAVTNVPQENSQQECPIATQLVGSRAVELTQTDTVSEQASHPSAALLSKSPRRSLQSQMLSINDDDRAFGDLLRDTAVDTQITSDGSESHSTPGRRSCGGSDKAYVSEVRNASDDEYNAEDLPGVRQRRPSWNRPLEIHSKATTHAPKSNSRPPALDAEVVASDWDSVSMDENAAMQAAAAVAGDEVPRHHANASDFWDSGGNVDFAAAAATQHAGCHASSSPSVQSASPREDRLRPQSSKFKSNAPAEGGLQRSRLGSAEASQESTSSSDDDAVPGWEASHNSWDGRPADTPPGVPLGAGRRIAGKAPGAATPAATMSASATKATTHAPKSNSRPPALDAEADERQCFPSHQRTEPRLLNPSGEQEFEQEQPVRSASQLFTAIDTNKDGVVDMNEFKAAAASGALQAKAFDASNLDRCLTATPTVSELAPSTALAGSVLRNATQTGRTSLNSAAIGVVSTSPSSGILDSAKLPPLAGTSWEPHSERRSKDQDAHAPLHHITSSPKSPPRTPLASDGSPNHESTVDLAQLLQPLPANSQARSACVVERVPRTPPVSDAKPRAHTACDHLMPKLQKPLQKMPSQGVSPAHVGGIGWHPRHSRSRDVGSMKASPHAPHASGTSPRGETTADLAQLLQPSIKSQLPGSKARAAVASDAKQQKLQRENTGELVHLLQPTRDRHPSSGSSQQAKSSQKQNPQPAEKTEDLTELLRSAASGVNSCHQGGVKSSKPDSRMPKPHMQMPPSSSSGNTELRFTDEFMESLEQYIEDSRRDFENDDCAEDLDPQAAQESSGGHDAEPEQPQLETSADTTSHTGGLRQLHGRGQRTDNREDTALRLASAGRGALEPYLDAAWRVVNEGTMLGTELLADAQCFFQASGQRVHQSTIDFAQVLQGALTRVDRYLWLRILKLLLLSLFMLLVLFLIVIELNWRLGPQPEVFY